MFFFPPAFRFNHFLLPSTAATKKDETHRGAKRSGSLVQDTTWHTQTKLQL